MAVDWYYQETTGETRGPFDANQLLRMVVTGTITPDVLIRKREDGDWIAAEQIQGLITQSTSFTPSPTVATPAVETTSEEPPSAATPPPGLESAPQPLPESKDCPFCAESIALAALKCKHCGEFLDRDAPSRHFAPTPSISYPETTTRSAQPAGDATGGVIPYKNTPALFAYYFGVFSVIPCFMTGLVGLYLGIIGLKRARAQPHVRGQFHAWIGILVGGLFGIGYAILTVVGIMASL